MRWLYIILFTVLCTSCKDNDEWISPPEVGQSTVPGVLMYKGRAYTGYVYSLFPFGDTESVRQYKDGKLHGESRGWFTTGRQKAKY